ncbi:MAG: hypothetical protein K940chlam7_00156 [Chlamydiae bacterium]|nr:hypothetical protein [Chlamydiota bacterium]
MNAITEAYSVLKKGFADGVLEKKEIEGHEKQINIACTVAKVIAIAAGLLLLTASIFMIATGSPLAIGFGVVLGGVGAVASHDFYHVADNLKTVVHDFATGELTELNEENREIRLSRGTIFAAPIIAHLFSKIKVEEYKDGAKV